MIKSLVYACVDVVATVLAAVIWLVGPILTGPVRLVRLAQLRSRIRGVAPVTTQLEGKVQITPGACITLDRYCRLGRNLFLETQEQGSITLGSHVRINSGCVIVSYAKVQIGDDCLIGEYVSIRDADHGTAIGQPIRSQPHTAEPIIVDDDVWIGRGSVVLKGVRIGTGAIVAANSVVTRSVPPFAVVAGAPAKVVKQRGDSPTDHAAGTEDAQG